MSQGPVRYAKALFELVNQHEPVTSKGGLIPKTLADVHTVAGLFADEPSLQTFLISPHISIDQKIQIIQELVEATKATDLTRRFLGVLVKNKRLSWLPAIAVALEDLAQRQRGAQNILLTTARELTPAEKSAALETLKDAMGTDIDLHCRINPDLMDGYRLQRGSQQIDNSLATKLAKLQKTLEGTA